MCYLTGCIKSKKQTITIEKDTPNMELNTSETYFKMTGKKLITHKIQKVSVVLTSKIMSALVKMKRNMQQDEVGL